MSHLLVVVSGQGDLYREFFNAIAATLGDHTYLRLIRLSLLLGGTWALVLAITKQSLMLHLRWLVMSLVLFNLTFVPKATVHIMDRQAKGTPYVVDNIPLGLAIVANLTTTIGMGITELLESNFTLPDFPPYLDTGMVMASKMLRASRHFQIQEPRFAENLEHFIHQCVFYDILLRKYSAHDLLSAQDPWGFIRQHASPARAFLYNQKITICRQGSQQLSQDWQQALQSTQRHYAHQLLPSHRLASVELGKRLAMGTSYLTGTSQSAATLMQHSLLANAIHSASTHLPARLASMAVTKAQSHKRLSNATIGELAAYWLPLMRNAFELILLGAFLLIFPLSLFPFGSSILKNYIVALAWLQLWSPLYAIINLIVSFYARTHSMAVFEGSLNLTTLSGLAEVNADMVGMAGYLSISVPFLAAGLIKGTVATFVQMAQYIGGVTQSSAISAASEAATGTAAEFGQAGGGVIGGVVVDVMLWITAESHVVAYGTVFLLEGLLLLVALFLTYSVNRGDTLAHTEAEFDTQAGLTLAGL